MIGAQYTQLDSVGLDPMAVIDRGTQPISALLVYDNKGAYVGVRVICHFWTASGAAHTLAGPEGIKSLPLRLTALVIEITQIE